MYTTLDFKSVRKSYRREAALRGVSFQLETGTVVGLIGPNGSGKSTALKLLSGTILPDEGIIRIPDLLLRMGLQTETFSVPMRMSGIAWLRFQRRMEKSAVSDFETRMVQRLGMTEHLKKSTKSYSKGMLKKLAILSAFIGTPAVVLLDEPFEGLDPVDRHEFMLLVREYATMGNLVLISSHLLYELDDACDRILILKRGELIRDLGRERDSLQSMYIDLFREGV
jgi:ABC-2 type transport system ATP-binding protein